MNVDKLLVSPNPKMQILPLDGKKDEKLSWVRVEGCRLVNENGKTQVLRGMNLGGFLVEEVWMMPFETTPPKDSAFPHVKDHVSLYQTLESRLGISDARQICTALRNAWLTEKDFERIRAAGFNCVRLPFLHDMVDEPEGLFPRLDWTIDCASKHGMYVILDMHGTPGRQSDEHHTGKEKSCRLFYDYTNVQKTIDLWVKIAERYKDRPEIVGYDLMNEPMGAPCTATLYLVQDRIYSAIRKVDTKHVIFIEDGFKGIDSMPSPQHVGWNNVVLSTHAYAFTEKTEEGCFKSFEKEITAIAAKRDALNAPFFLGEFNGAPGGNSTTVHRIISMLDERELSWSYWTYKMVTSRKEKVSMWGIYSAHKQMKLINPFTDSKEEILTKIELLRTEHFDEHKALLEVFQLEACGVKPIVPVPAIDSSPVAAATKVSEVPPVSVSIPSVSATELPKPLASPVVSGETVSSSAASQ
jgi:endoglucanase